MPSVRSSLLLFVGVDLAGSTAYKAKNSRPEEFHKWLPIFTGFYYRFPDHLRSEIERTKDFGTPPTLWKAGGDELLFTRPIEKPDDAWRVVLSFERAVRAYRAELTKKEPTLDIKAHAWLAGFPVVNTKIPLSRDLDLKVDVDDEPEVVAYRIARELENNPSATVDYIGPSIDAGFRIGKLATPKRFALSVELAHMLCDTIGNDDEKPEVQFSGTNSTLKGVLGDKPYPELWLETETDIEPSQLQRAEDKLLKRRFPHSDVKQYCNAFMATTEGSVCRPYIISEDGAVVYGTVPEAHAKALQKLRDAAEKQERNPYYERMLKQDGDAGSSDAPALYTTELAQAALIGLDDWLKDFDVNALAELLAAVDPSKKK